MKLVDLIRMIDEEDIITDSRELKDKETDCHIYCPTTYIH